MYILNKNYTLGGGMTKRLKVLLSVLIVVAALAVVTFVYFGKQIGLNASADTYGQAADKASKFAALAHIHDVEPNPDGSPSPTPWVSPVKYKLTGTVVDKKTKKPIEAIELSMGIKYKEGYGGYTAYTDKLGKYTLEFAGPDSYSVSVKDYTNNYEPTTFQIVVTTKGVIDFDGKLSLNPVKKFTIATWAGNGGKISPSGDVQVVSGKNQEFIITPDKGYQISSVLLDQKAATRSSTGGYTFNNVTANHTISVTFTPIVVETVVINAMANTGGNISPAGAMTVKSGGSQTFYVTADYGYKISNVIAENTLAACKVDFGSAIGKTSATIKVSKVKSRCILNVLFASSWSASGYVTQSRKSVAGATVQLSEFATKTPVLVSTTTTDASGRYEFGQMYPGSYGVRVTARICTKYWFYTSCTNKVKSFNFTMAPGQNTSLPAINY